MSPFPDAQERYREVMARASREVTRSLRAVRNRGDVMANRDVMRNTEELIKVSKLLKEQLSTTVDEFNNWINELQAELDRVQRLAAEPSEGESP